MQKRILYTAFDVVPSPKGATTHIVHFLDGLVNAGYQVDLLTPGDGVLPGRDTLAGAQVWRTPHLAGENFLRRAVAYGEAVLAHVATQPAYHFAHYRSVWSGLPLGMVRNAHGYKTIFEVNGLPSIELKYHYPGLHGSDLLAKIREQELAALALSDAVVCPSDVTRQFLTSLGVPRHKITVIPNGVSPNDFPATPLPPNDGHIPVILYIGTLADWQGLEVILRALPAILAERPVRLRIIGPGRSRQRKVLAKQARKLGVAEAVELAGALPHHEIAEAIAAADLCVAPLSLNDRNIVQGCCPIKVIEYMACARPLVAANLPVVRELVRENIDGLLFFPDDATDLARQVQTLLADRELAARLATSAAARARGRFTWHAAQKRLAQVYARL